MYALMAEALISKHVAERDREVGRTGLTDILSKAEEIGFSQDELAAMVTVIAHSPHDDPIVKAAKEIVSKAVNYGEYTHSASMKDIKRGKKTDEKPLKIRKVDAYAEISKIDKARQEVFGWASVAKIDGNPVLDRQKDMISSEELENAAYDYVLHSRVGGEMHLRDDSIDKSQPREVARLIESFVVTPQKLEAIGISKAAANKIPEGWWVGFKVTDPVAWSKVESGIYKGFSVHGKGKRKALV